MAKGFILLLLCVCCLTSCIFEDRSACPPKGFDYDLTYSLRLTTELRLALQEQLDEHTDSVLYRALEEYLQTVFTDKAHDVDLHFYDLLTGDSEHQESHIIDANQASLVIKLPKEEYMHLAVANVASNNMVLLSDTTNSQTERLTDSQGIKPIRSKQPNKITGQTESHTTGIFAARLPMYIVQNEDQHFDVTLYMVNAATIVVLDTVGSNVKDIEVQVEQMASGFMVQDSVFVYDNLQNIVANRVESQNTPLIYSAVSFPSTDEGNWQVRINTWNNSNEQAETVLTVPEPLRAGGLKIIKAKIADNGTVTTSSLNIGVSVTLDWKNGGEHEIEL